MRINREAITKIQKKYPYGCGSHSGQYVLVIEKSLMSTTNLKDHVNVSDENLPGLCHLLLSSSFFFQKNELSFDQTGQKASGEGLSILSNEWQNFPQKNV